MPEEYYACACPDFGAALRKAEVLNLVGGLNMKKEILFTDLGGMCVPQDNVTEKRCNDKWRSVSYETADFTGTMLSSQGICRPKPISLPVNLSGWYKIYIGAVPEYGELLVKTDIKLSNENAYWHLSADGSTLKYSEHCITETYWRSADMTGLSVDIANCATAGRWVDVNIAWLRFVPMSGNEIKEYIADTQCRDTKRIYAANDMSNMLYNYDMSNPDSWESVGQVYKESDVEWLSVENLSYVHNRNELSGDTAVPYQHAKNIIEQRNNYCDDVLKRIGDCVHNQKIKLCITKRVNMWNFEYPEDGLFYDDEFYLAHPEYRCTDRDGTKLEYLSFVYPEVQDYIIKGYINVLKSGCDAVGLLLNRGWPFVLFEQPFLDMFYERYGEDARVLPLDDERVTKLRCEIMTSFIRRLRSALDKAENDRRIEIHAFVMYSMWDCRHTGLDPEVWAKEKLVDIIISDERRIREVLDGDIWTENTHKIDIEKYKQFVRRREKTNIQYDYDNLFPPMEDSGGILRGPESQQERISEFTELEKKYGVTVYIDIMPREMPPEEIRRRVSLVYACGCKHICLWDTETRVTRLNEWNVWRKAGHIGEIFDMPIENTKNYRILKLNGRDVSRYKPMHGG